MSEQLRTRLFEALDAIELVDPHTHINAHAPASTTLADILGYHYYTELAHSAGMPRADRGARPGAQGKGGPPDRVPGHDRKHDPIELARRDGAGVFWFCRRGDHAGQLGSPLRSLGRRDAKPRLGTAGAQAKQAQRGVSHQRFRRSADRLRHVALHSLPADRRPRLPPGQRIRPPATGQGRRHERRRRPQPAHRDRQAVRALRGPRRPGVCHFAASRFRAGGASSRPPPKRLLPTSIAAAPRPTRPTSATRDCSCFGPWPNTVPSSSSPST